VGADEDDYTLAQVGVVLGRLINKEKVDMYSNTDFYTLEILDASDQKVFLVNENKSAVTANELITRLDALENLLPPYSRADGKDPTPEEQRNLDTLRIAAAIIHMYCVKTVDPVSVR
jgi:hypothetical protein